MVCALCQNNTPAGQLDRFSGVDLCDYCRVTDPSESLTALGFAVAWDVKFMRFVASVHLPDQRADFYLRCTPELWHHKVAKWVIHEVQVGDPAFDKRVFIRTSDPDRASEILANDGMQSALLSLLTGLRTNELIASHVTVERGVLQVNIRPTDSLSPERTQELQLETAVLALHLRAT
ncbi:MAG: hypothetical protein GWP91_10165 [Rhodobacterales bacterium]|nr:hypothetical protein [Rhodobacterales bacterium]